MNETIEFKKPEIEIVRHSLEKKQEPYKPYCAHPGLVIDRERGIVTCKYCSHEMSPLEGILLLCNKIWWQENNRERRIEYDLKCIAKTQKAAFLRLFEAGVTPEKYAERWAKEESERVQAAVSISEAKSKVAEIGGRP